MSRVEEIKNLVEETTEEMEKFYDKGNKAAGTRARKGLQEVNNPRGKPTRHYSLLEHL